jgi:predicted secreted protein
MKKLWCVPFGFSTKVSEVAVYEPEVMYDQSLVTEHDFANSQDMRSQNERLEEQNKHKESS